MAKLKKVDMEKELKELKELKESLSPPPKYSVFYMCGDKPLEQEAVGYIESCQNGIYFYKITIKHEREIVAFFSKSVFIVAMQK